MAKLIQVVHNQSLNVVAYAATCDRVINERLPNSIAGLRSHITNNHKPFGAGIDVDAIESVTEAIVILAHLEETGQ
jgi:hypothetical protein